MVLIEDGSSEHVAQYEVKKVFAEKSWIWLLIDVTKCLQQIEMPDLLHMCSPCSELPYYTSTMLEGRKIKGPLFINLPETSKYNLTLLILNGINYI